METCVRNLQGKTIEGIEEYLALPLTTVTDPPEPDEASIKATQIKSIVQWFLIYKDASDIDKDRIRNTPGFRRIYLALQRNPLAADFMAKTLGQELEQALSDNILADDYIPTGIPPRRGMVANNLNRGYILFSRPDGVTLVVKNQLELSHI